MISLVNLFSSSKIVAGTSANKFTILNNNLIKLFILTVILQCLIQVGLEIIILKYAIEGLEGVTRIQLQNDKSLTGLAISTIPIPTCSDALTWSISYLFRLETRSITLMVSQIWLLILSIVGIARGGLPFLSTMMATHFILTGWAIFQTIQIHTSTLLFQSNLNSSPCSKIFIDDSFWKGLLIVSIPIVVLEGIFLIIIGMISYKLLPVLKGYRSSPGSEGRRNPYETTTFLYRTSLLFTTFFLISSQSIWVVTLNRNHWSSSLKTVGAFLEKPQDRVYYEWFLVALVVLVGPWSIIGYWVVGVVGRKKWILVAVLGLNAVFIVHPAYLATQKSYIRMMPTFQFLAFLGSVSIVGSIITFVLGCMCLYGFFKDDTPAQQFVPFVPDTYKFDVEKRSQPSKILPVQYSSVTKPNLVSHTPVPSLISNTNNQGFAPSTSQLTSRPRATSSVSNNRLTRSFSLWRSKSRKSLPDQLDLDLNQKKKVKSSKKKNRNREEVEVTSPGSSFQGDSTPTTPDEELVLRDSWSSVNSTSVTEIGGNDHRRRSSVPNFNLR